MRCPMKITISSDEKNKAFSENGRLLKKSFSGRWLLISIACIGAAMISLIYGIAALTDVKNTPLKYAEDYYSNTLLSSDLLSTGMSLGITFILLALPLIGLTLLFINARNKTTDSIPNPAFTLFKVYFIISIVLSSMNLMTAFTEALSYMASLSTAETDSDKLSKFFLSFLLNSTPSFLFLFTAIAGLRSCNSIRKTIAKDGMYTEGIISFKILVIFYVVLQVFICIYYCATGFKDGSFASYYGEKKNSAMIMRFSGFNVFMYIVYRFSLMAALLFSAIMAGKYNKIFKHEILYKKINGINESSPKDENDDPVPAIPQPVFAPAGFPPPPPFPPRTPGQGMYPPPPGFDPRMNGRTPGSRPLPPPGFDPRMNGGIPGSGPLPPSGFEPRMNAGNPPVPADNQQKSDFPADNIICPVCGRKNKIGMKFCQHCGNMLPFYGR